MIRWFLRVAWEGVKARLGTPRQPVCDDPLHIGGSELPPNLTRDEREAARFL
jgi:hypothetical protein